MTLDNLINYAKFYPTIDWMTLSKFEIKETLKNDEFNFIKNVNNALNLLRIKEKITPEDKEYYNNFIKLWQEEESQKDLAIQ